MRVSDKIKGVLMELEEEGQLKGLNVEVESSGGGRFIVDVTSASFAEIPEEIRQDLVWGKIIQRLDDFEQRLVEFIYTPSPLEEKTSGEPLPRRKRPAKGR